MIIVPVQWHYTYIRTLHERPYICEVIIENNKMRNKIRRRSYINAHFGRRDVFENFPQNECRKQFSKNANFFLMVPFPSTTGISSQGK